MKRRCPSHRYTSVHKQNVGTASPHKSRARHEVWGGVGGSLRARTVPDGTPRGRAARNAKQNGLRRHVSSRPPENKRATGPTPPGTPPPSAPQTAGQRDRIPQTLRKGGGPDGDPKRSAIRRGPGDPPVGGRVTAITPPTCPRTTSGWRPADRHAQGRGQGQGSP